jgi:hypothetical protein
MPPKTHWSLIISQLGTDMTTSFVCTGHIAQNNLTKFEILAHLKKAAIGAKNFISARQFFDSFE